MRQITMTVLLALVATAAFTQARSADDEPKKAEAKPENKLVGTWKMVSAKYDGQDVTFPEGTTRLKHITTTQCMWAAYDKDGKVDAALGGPYTLKGDKYEETPEYGIGDVLELLKGKRQSFECKVEANKLYQKGKLSSGLTLEEVWERVEKK
jgi:hypothetical protein